MRDFDYSTVSAIVLPIVISRISCTPKALLLVRDPFGGKMRFSLSTLSRGEILASSHSLIAANQATKYGMTPTEAP